VAPKKTAQQVELQFERLSQERFEFALIGTTPLIINRVSEKAKRQLLWPSRGGSTEARKTGTLKHDPLGEFRSSAYQLRRADSPTLVAFPAGGFKNCMAVAALEVAGVNKSQVERLIFVERGLESDLIPIFGQPRLLMNIARNSDQNHTPDVRTRCIVEPWAAVFTVRYVVPRLTIASVANLLASAGMVAGLGDWRPEKGGDHGQFEVVAHGDPRLEQIIAEGGRDVQERMFAEPQPYDAESADLLEWYESEYLRRVGVPMGYGNGAGDELEAEEAEVLA